MLDLKRPARPARRALERQHRVARRFGRIDLARPAPARRCRGRRTGRRRAPRPADRLAHRRDQRRLAVLGRLEEGAERQRDRDAAERDGRPAPARRAFRARSRRRARAGRGRWRSQKAVSASAASSPSTLDAFEQHIDALVGQRQLHFGGALGPAGSCRAARAAARPERTVRARGYGIRACRRCGCCRPR